MTLVLRLAVVTLLIACLLASINCGTKIEATTSNIHGLDRANLDTTCQPCEDFYRFANGNWMKNNPIPDIYSEWGVGYEIYDRNSELLHKILEDAASQATAATGSVAQQVGDIYYSGMNTERANAEGAAPLADDFIAINAINSISDLQSMVNGYHAEGIDMIFDLDIGPNLEDNDKVIMYVTQGGLGLPDRDYYTRDDVESDTLRRQYVDHVARMLVLAGISEADAATQAERVMAIETRLAKASLTNVEMREPEAWYHVETVAAADELTPLFSWTRYLADLGHPEIESFSYTHPKFFAEMDAALKEIPLNDWKAYLRWHITARSARYMSDTFVHERFAFYGTTLRGTKELAPRWKRVMNLVNGTIGQPLGQLFVKEAFPPQSKERAEDMVNNLLAAFQDRLEALHWMSDETKKQALTKLAAFNYKIGYPDKWRDYSNLKIDRGTYNNNVRQARKFDMDFELAKIGQPVDRSEWAMNPQTVNAYYNPQFNEVVFPAGILQPPYFDGEIDDAINYGAMGAIIGHEITHGFDDQGRLFDANGNFADWWNEGDTERFSALTDAMVEQFDGYVAIDSLHLNGRLTLGENIADLGGLTVSYHALQRALEGKPREEVDGFTPEQRFFLSWAQAWRANQRPEALKVQVNTDPHSPANFRVLGPLSNLSEFRDAFGCDESSPMVRAEEKQVTIW